MKFLSIKKRKKRNDWDETDIFIIHWNIFFFWFIFDVSVSQGKRHVGLND